MWAGRRANSRGERVAADECPVSLITGGSRAALEEWWTLRRLGGVRFSAAEAARKVDAWLTLESELETLEAENDAR